MAGASSLLAIAAMAVAVQSGAPNNVPAKPVAAPPPAKLEPLRPERPTPAQRVMPGIY